MAKAVSGGSSPLSQLLVHHRRMKSGHDQPFHPFFFDVREKVMGAEVMYTRVDNTSDSREALQLPLASPKQRLTRRSMFALQIFLFIGAVTFFVMLYKSFALGAVVGCVGGAVASSASKSSSNNHDIPQYLQTKPELFAGQYVEQAS